MPFINIRWADNTAQLRQNLKQGVDQIEATRASAEKMARSLGGDNLVAAAHKYAAAVAEIGGAANLTAANQARVNSVMTKAVEVLEAAGKGGTATAQHFRSLADQTKVAASEMSLASKGVGQLSDAFTTLTAAFTVGQLIGRAINGLIDWGREAIKTAGTLVDLSAKTGLSTETLQRMDFVGKQAGVTLENFTDAAFKLGVRLSDGNKKTRESVDALGLSYETLKHQRPDEQFNSIVAAMERMQDPQERNRIGVELFGKSFAGIASAVTKGYTDMARSATVSSDEQIKAIDDASDAWDRFLDRQKKGITSWLGNAVITSQTVTSLTKDELHQLMAARDAGEAYAVTLQKIAKARAAARATNEPPLPVPPTKTIEAFTAQLAKARAELAKLTAEERKEITAAQALGKSTDEIADRFGVSEAAIRLLTSSTKSYESAQKKASVETERAKEAHAKVIAKIREMESVLPQLTQSVGQLDTTELKSVETHLNNKEALDKTRLALEKLHATISAFERVGFNSVTQGLEDVGTKVPILSDAQQKMIKAKDATDQWGKVLDDLSNTFTQLAIIAGPTFGEIARAIGIAIVSIKGFQAALKDAADEEKEFGKVSLATNAAVAFSIVNMGLAVVSYLNQWEKSKDAQRELENQSHLVIQLGKDFKVTTQFSKQLTDSIRQLAKTKFDIREGDEISPFIRESLEALKLIDIIKELGGVSRLSGDTLKYVQARMQDLFAFAQGGDMQALEDMDSILADMGQSATKSGGLVSKFFLDMIAKAQRVGIELEKVNAFLLDQAKTNIIGGLSGFLAQGKDAKATLEDVRKKMSEIKAERDDLLRRGTLGVSDSARLKELNKQWADLEAQAKKASGVLAGTAIKTQEAAYALGATVFAAFDQMRKAGVPISEIMAQLGPVIEDLQAKFEAAGFDGGEAFNSIRSMAALAKDEIAGPIISGINGLGQALAGLHNIGALDQNTFAGLTQQITGMYQSLVKQGKGGVDALRLLQQPLQTIWALHKDTGLAIDEATQALLDEAEAQGIVGDKMRPIQEKQLIATERIADAVEKIGELFGVLPKKAEDAAKGITDGLAKIKIPRVDIPYRYYQDGEYPEGTIPFNPDLGKPIGGGGPYPTLSTGGIVRSRGIQRFSTGGMAQSTGPDTIPALLSVGEIVLNKQQQQAVLDMLQAGVAMAELVNATRAATQNTTTINITPPVANASTSIAPMPGPFPTPVPAPSPDLPSVKWDVIDAWMVELIDAIRQLTNTLRSVELPQLQPLPLPFPTQFPFPIDQPAPPLPLPGPIRYFTEGGIVSNEGFPGQPRGRDTVPAWLEVGESVLTKEATDRIGTDRVLALNAGRVEYLQQGGTVGPSLPRNVIPTPTGAWNLSVPEQERILITELQAHTRVLNQFITSADSRAAQIANSATSTGPVELIGELDGHQLIRWMWDPQTLSGDARQKARLQVQQMEKER